MLKKIILLVSLILLSFFYNLDFTFSNCSYDGNGSVVNAIEGCVGDGQTDLVETGNNLEVADGFKTKIIDWIKKIATILALGAIFSIALGSMKLVLSRGEEEGIKKAKDIIKWGILGLLGIVSAGFLISVLVKFIYSVGNV